MKNIPQLTTLPNGVRVLTYFKPNKRLCTAVSVNVGALVESPSENGLTHFVEHMLFKGTETRSAVDISREVEVTGADMNAFTSYDMTTYYIEGLAEHADMALDVLSDMLLKSKFDPKEVESEHDVVCQEIAMYLDNMRDRARNGLCSVAYPNQPAGRPIIGNEQNVCSFDQAAIRAFIAKNYHSANVVVSGVGDIDHEEFVQKVSKYFEEITVGHEQNVPDKSNYEGGFFKYADNSREQAVAFLAYPLPKGITRAEYRKFGILSQLVGGGMSSPLFQEVREKRGLCYSVGAAVMSTAAGAMFIITGATSAQHLEEMVQVSKAELERVANGDINPDDLTRAKNSTKLGLLSMDDAQIDIAVNFTRDLFEGREFETADTLMSSVNQITIADMEEAAKYLLSQKPSLALTGDVPDIEWVEGI